VQISIAMTVRNNERYLQPLLDSLARQTRRPLELVAHDDASDDATPAILERFARAAPFEVRIERAPAPLGAPEGFLHAAAGCRGDAVAFCDSDDVWLDHKLETCHAALERSGAELALHATRVVDARLREIAPPWPAVGSTRVVPPLGLTGLAVDAPGMAMVYRRRVVRVADPARRPPSRYGPGRQMMHDEWVLFLAGVLGPVQLIAEQLLLYRQHEGNDSGWFQRSRRTTLEPAIGDYRAAAEHYGACADYLASTRSDDPAVAERLAAGADYYRRAAEAWGLRTELYRARDRRSRARIVRRLVASDAYRPTAAGGFGRRALGKDVVGGVAIGVAARDG
jgi:glycosyltransferase involved in cell wall biosynthesis